MLQMAWKTMRTTCCMTQFKVFRTGGIGVVPPPPPKSLLILPTWIICRPTPTKD